MLQQQNPRGAPDRGLLSLNNHRIQILFSVKVVGHPVFGATMSKNRFRFLASNVSSNDETSKLQRWSAYRFAAFQVVLENFCDNCARHVLTDNFLHLS